ncbi:methyltransferase, UbiE/COQ5 family protein [Oceanicola granulosus HTCC2516]|uniref:Methyltransferase, UbiE/COQ5 family protein n=1 Tax=Oceanicola granulosus (strain ATCC BAA-861 / DSM 15982 / KCTC 12143 / HTCC2516) TaxID=314256 RepID=Q2CBK3_OCEGH|nr:class I SAM-dependent methyltransferase [Oceanicola granulosus]EAR50042.1 methyltransferase, UbiE/COQ5 family protein [Oceanicola granulosus HTCC2516]
MPQTSRFWDKIARRYARRPVDDPAAYEAKLAKTAEYLTPDSEVLELACGTGTTALWHAPKVRHVLATDFSAPMLEIARARAAEQGVENVTFRQTAIEALEVAPASYDMVMAHSILHLVDDRQVVYALARAALKPGGHFVSSTVCLGRLSPMRLILVPGHAIGLLPQVRFLSADGLAAEIEAAGFEIVHRYRPKRLSAVFFVARKRP